jgi:hypothetical protein
MAKGLKVKQIVWNFVQQLNTQHICHPLTQNTIKAFKSRAQATFSMLEKPPPLVYKIWVREIFFIILHYKFPIAVLRNWEQFQISSVFLYTL